MVGPLEASLQRTKEGPTLCGAAVVRIEGGGDLADVLDTIFQGFLLLLDLGEVLATNQANAVMAFYGQSYALVRFLREAGFGRYYSRLRLTSAPRPFGPGRLYVRGRSLRRR